MPKVTGRDEPRTKHVGNGERRSHGRRSRLDGKGSKTGCAERRKIVSYGDGDSETYSGDSRAVFTYLGESMLTRRPVAMVKRRGRLSDAYGGRPAGEVTGMGRRLKTF